MTAHAGEAGGADRGEALLWAAPTGAFPAPPIDTRPQVLPIGELHWPDAEKLFLRLLDGARPVQYAKLFGVPGQTQAGIDAYARLPLERTDSSTGGRDYITLQSRRVESLTAARIKETVDDVLKGEWADKTSAFTLRSRSTSRTPSWTPRSASRPNASPNSRSPSSRGASRRSPGC